MGLNNISKIIIIIINKTSKQKQKQKEKKQGKNTAAFKKVRVLLFVRLLNLFFQRAHLKRD